MDAFWIISVAFLSAGACGILGCFLLLRKMAMLGDAIAHAVLPGIVIAYLMTGTRNPLFMLMGASVVGIACTFLIQWIHQKTKIYSDAALGLTYTLFFAVGIILISAFTGMVDLDQECVLYGEIAYVPLDIWEWEGGINAGPRAFYVTGISFIVVVLFVIIGWKYLAITTFDPSFAAQIGVSVGLWHYLLMGFVSVTTVASFEVVGAILIVAMISIHPAIVYLFARSLKQMLIGTLALALVSCTIGYFVAVFFNISIAGSIVCIAGFELCIALVLKVIFKYSRKSQLSTYPN